MQQFNRTYVYSICLASALGGFLFGYDWVVIGGAKPFYEVSFCIAGLPAMQGMAMSVALLGCLAGAMVAGALADRFGRRSLLLMAAAVFLVSSCATGAFSAFSYFLVARFLGGIGIGVASCLSPTYIAEVAPSAVRGRLVAANQLAIVLGILGAQTVNWLIADPVPAGTGPVELALSWNVRWGWRWMFWAAALPSAMFLVAASLIPESPRWLAGQGLTEAAKRVLVRVGGAAYADMVLRDMAAVADTAGLRSGLCTLLSRPYRRVLVIGVVVAVFQQWCGTNVIFNYAQEIFQAAGFELGDVLFNIVITGVANLVFTFVAIFTVDRLGRRTLMLLGAGGLAGIYLILGACYFFHVSGLLMIVLVVAAIGCYAMSLGPVTWVLLAEIFPNCVRGVAVAVATFALWAACFILTYTFPLLNDWLGSSGTFWIYAAICAGGFVFIMCVLPETKGNTLEDLEKELVR